MFLNGLMHEFYWVFVKFFKGINFLLKREVGDAWLGIL